jgi:hypothetical protein
VHTIKFVLQPMAARPLAGLTYVGTDHLKRKGKMVRYDSYIGKTSAATNKHVVWAAFAIRGGMIMVRLSQHKDGARGPILSGSGGY